jgi:hypothetical protein
MSTRLIVDKEKGLEESRRRLPSDHPPPVEWAAKIVSWIFHPVFVPVYLILFIVYIHPYLFAGFTPFNKTQTVIMSFMMYCFFPLITVGLLKGLKLIDTVYLEMQKDRVIPLVACGVWYFWVWFVWRNLPEYPAQAVQLSLGIWISASLGLMANIAMKVSLHSIAMGVMITFMLLLAFSGSINFGNYLSIAFLVTGLVCTSRFIISDHKPIEVYGGLATGIISMLIGYALG